MNNFIVKHMKFNINYNKQYNVIATDFLYDGFFQALPNKTKKFLPYSQGCPNSTIAPPPHPNHQADHCPRSLINTTTAHKFALDPKTYWASDQCVYALR